MLRPMERLRDLARRLARRIEATWLRRWYLAPRMKITKLDLRLDLQAPGGQVKATADFAFRPQVSSVNMACLIGDVAIHSASWGDRPIKARCNPPFLVLKFPKPLPAINEQRVSLRYTYRPDVYGTLLQPTTREDCPERIAITCRRPLLALVQGHLESGTESPPLRTYNWVPQRSRKLNVILADVRSFKKQMGAMSMWLHCHADAVSRAPRILDLLASIYDECASSHHRKLPHADFHVVESDDRDVPAFNSPGLIVVPRGTFAVDDKPTVYGILAPEFNKEWNRQVSSMAAEGKAD